MPSYVRSAAPQIVWPPQQTQASEPNSRQGEAPAPPNEDERGVGGDETFSEALSRDIFSTYVCRYA